MKPTTFLAERSTENPILSPLPTTATQPTPQPQLTAIGTPPGESIRHILLGSPEAIRQTIHLLHTLRYSETVLWSPVLKVEEPIIVTPAQGEAMSLLRKLL